MNLYAVVVTTIAPSIGSDEPLKTRKLELVEAERSEDAVQLLCNSSNVYSLKFGRTFEVFTVEGEAEVWHAQYDGEPMIDHAATDAKLVIVRRLDLEGTR